MKVNTSTLFMLAASFSSAAAGSTKSESDNSRFPANDASSYLRQNRNLHRRLQATQFPSGERNCLQKRWDNEFSGNGELTCTANDVELSVVEILPGGPEYCNSGEHVTLSGNFLLQLNSQGRYDIGLYLLTSANELVSAQFGESCYVLGLPFEDTTEANICGDITTLSEKIEEATIDLPCIAGMNGNLTLPYCTTWKQNNADNCNSVDQLSPGTKSKCNCNEVPVPVKVCTLDIQPTLYESCEGGKFEFASSLSGSGPGGASITWKITGTDKTATGASGFFDGLTAGSYDVTVDVVDGPCTKLDVVAGTVMVYDDLVVDGELTGGCEGTYSGSVTSLVGSRTSGSGTYTWEDNASTIISTSNEFNSLVPPQTGDVTATVSYTESCSNCKSSSPTCSAQSDPSTVQVYNTIQVDPTLYESCEGGNFEYEATASEGAGPGTYAFLWTVDGTGITATGASGTVDMLATGNYQVNVDVTSGPCTTSAPAGSIAVYESLSITGKVTGGCTGTYSVSVTNKQGGGRATGTYEWMDPDGNPIAYVENASGLTPSEVGDVTAKVTYTEPCNQCRPSTPSCSDTSPPSTNQVYNPIQVTASGSMDDPTCEVGGIADSERGKFPVTLTVQGGSGTFNYSTNSADLTCPADAKTNSCLLDLSGKSEECLSDAYVITVTDEGESCCGAVGSNEFGISKTTIYAFV